jgi:bla regulator protein BlaR1
VWWLGARLVDERERACDEEVLRLGSEPEAYAAGILKTCQFYLEAPLVCMAGVTGSDLKRRIERIMTHPITKQLDLGKKVLLAAAAFSAIAAPIAFGVMSAPPIRAQARASTAKPIIQVVSIKRNTSGEGNSMFTMPLGEKFTATNVRARMLIAMAYDLKPHQLSGAPDWLESEKYDIQAKTGAPADRDQMKLTMQALLADRFKLAIHLDPKEMPIYALVASKGATKLRPAAGDGESKSQFRIGIGVGLLNLHGASMAQLADALSRVVGRDVIDKTGIAGTFDVELDWTPDERRDRMPEDAGPSLFTAIQEQLGLKLEAQKGPVDIVVIDHVEKPSQN